MSRPRGRECRRASSCLPLVCCVTVWMAEGECLPSLPHPSPPTAGGRSAEALTCCRTQESERALHLAWPRAELVLVQGLPMSQANGVWAGEREGRLTQTALRPRCRAFGWSTASSTPLMNCWSARGGWSYRSKTTGSQDSSRISESSPSEFSVLID